MSIASSSNTAATNVTLGGAPTGAVVVLQSGVTVLVKNLPIIRISAEAAQNQFVSRGYCIPEAAAAAYNQWKDREGDGVQNGGSSDPVAPSLTTKAEKAVPAKHTEEHIRRPPNSWIIYHSAFCDAIKTLTFCDDEGTEGMLALNDVVSISKKAGRMWGSLSPQERIPWMEAAQRCLREHKVRYPDWVYKPRDKTKKPRQKTGKPRSKKTKSQVSMESARPTKRRKVTASEDVQVNESGSFVRPGPEPSLGLKLFTEHSDITIYYPPNEMASLSPDLPSLSSDLPSLSIDLPSLSADLPLDYFTENSHLYAQMHGDIHTDAGLYNVNFEEFVTPEAEFEFGSSHLTGSSDAQLFNDWLVQSQHDGYYGHY